jgi:RHS repeat-associated protein
VLFAIYVNDITGTIAEYEYDTLDRRISKDANGAETYFVYDYKGNIIAEYEKQGSSFEWQRDYVYGGSGEAVYMSLPRTAEMNQSLSNLSSFCDAWLCSPSCDSNDLQWDMDSDNDINFEDWALIDANNFTGAFADNGKFLLTDFRGSVVGMADEQGSITADISYDAWGNASCTGDLEGLSILWNGYYYDEETGNYYLRNRYHSPMERRFITDDPRGIRPDNNWNNPFAPKLQYSDGYGLKVYAGSDPINNSDPWGLWKYALSRAERRKEGRTFVEASGVWEWKYGIESLARLVRLNEEEFNKWGKRDIHKVNGVRKCGAWVPNTAYVDRGDISWDFYIGKIPNIWLITESHNIENHFLSEGYKTKLAKANRRSIVDSHLSNSDIIAWGFVGHGAGNGHIVLDFDENQGYDHNLAKNKINHKLAEVIIFACEAGRGGWGEIVSKYGQLHASSNSFDSWDDWDDIIQE